MATPIDTQAIADKIAEALASAIAPTSDAADAREAIDEDDDLELEESSRSSYQKDAESGAN